MTESASSLDVLVDDLLSHTESLVQAAETSPELSPYLLLEERGRVARALGQEAALNPLTPEQLRKLQRAIELGGKIRFPIAARRENLRNQLQELRESRKVLGALKPYRRTKGRRLNVTL